jgi:hypothetical protein
MVGVHRVRTLRGTVKEGETHRLVVDDGDLNHGYKVKRFIVSSRYPANAANGCFGTLHLDAITDPVWNWGDNRQIAWASTVVTSTGSSAGNNAPFELVDPDHIVLRDLFLTIQVGNSTADEALVNYFVELETVEINDNQAVLTLIKERSQDV